jgi:hypothetical protein
MMMKVMTLSSTKTGIADRILTIRKRSMGLL